MLIIPKQVKNLSYVVVDDLYSADEVEQIKTELWSLIPYWQPGENVGAALDEQNTTKKSAMGLFLDGHYSDRSKSQILNLNRRIFSREIIDKAAELNQYFYGIGLCNMDTTLVNYYRDGEEYKAHNDLSMLTVVTFFSLGKITGGDFEFPEVAEVVPFRENRTVIFPGCVAHAAKSVTTDKDSFRVSIAQFLNYRD